VTSRHIVPAIAAIWLLAALQACGGAPAPTGATADASPIPASAPEVAARAQDTVEVANASVVASLGRTEVLRSDGNGDRRFALVFGNGAYRHGDALAAPAKDAELMAAALRARGYHVLLGLDRDFEGMQQDVQAFEAMSEGARVRVLYFAGHGFEFDNANYLLPVDVPAHVAQLSRTDVRINALRLDALAWQLEQGAETLIAIVDACRVVPSRGATKAGALAAQDVAQGTILAYATAPGRVAMDSLRSYGVEEDHSPYTYYLANALKSVDIETWDQAFLSTYNIVKLQTRGEQMPWMNAQVNRFPRIGQDPGTPPRTNEPGDHVLDWEISASRSALGAFWAREAEAIARLERDGTQPDEGLRVLAASGDDRASVALAARQWEQSSRHAELTVILEAAAMRGHAVAQAELGSHLYRLKSKDSEGRSATYWWQLASAQGMGEARAKLALHGLSGSAGADEYGQGLMEMFKAVQSDSSEVADNENGPGG
jgi:hypothetical protein